MTYLRMQDLLKRIPVGETTSKRWLKGKTFPQPKKLGPRVTGYATAEVEAWEKARTEGLPPSSLA